jgi:predicted DNA-binding protein
MTNMQKDKEKKAINVRLPIYLLKKLEILAEKEGSFVSTLVRKAVIKYYGEKNEL